MAPATPDRPLCARVASPPSRTPHFASMADRRILRPRRVNTKYAARPSDRFILASICTSCCSHLRACFALGRILVPPAMYWLAAMAVSRHTGANSILPPSKLLSHASYHATPLPSQKESHYHLLFLSPHISMLPGKRHTLIRDSGHRHDTSLQKDSSPAFSYFHTAQSTRNARRAPPPRRWHFSWDI